MLAFPPWGRETSKLILDECDNHHNINIEIEIELNHCGYNANAPSGVTWMTGLVLKVTPAFRYVLLHHMMGESGWAYPEGGMGAVTQAMAAAAASYGAHIFTNVVRWAFC